VEQYGSCMLAKFKRVLHGLGLDLGYGVQIEDVPMDATEVQCPGVIRAYCGAVWGPWGPCLPNIVAGVLLPPFLVGGFEMENSGTVQT
jgi:hypothetical protein